MSNFVTRPSNLPKQALCPRFTNRGIGTSATASGTDRHAALESMFKGDNTLLKMLPDQEIEAVEWAYHLIKEVASRNEQEIETEVKLPIYRDNIQIMEGTIDAIVGDNLFDLKWSEMDYDEQMACYAIALMQRNKCSKVCVYVMYAANQHVKSYTLSYADAAAIVWPVYDAVKNPTSPPTPNKYCSWCLHQVSCSAVVQNVNKVAESFQVVPADQLSVVTPENVSAALNLAYLAEKWAAEVKIRAKELALSGMQIPGYSLSERAGNREIEPHMINEAYAALGIPHQEFMQACTVTISELESAFAKAHGFKKTQARIEFDNRLARILTNKPSSLILKKTK